MRIAVTIDAEVDLPDDVVSHARELAQQSTMDIENLLESETEMWWGLVESAPPSVTVRVVDE